MKRPARFPFRAKWFLTAYPGFVCCAAFAAEEDIPKLRPPHAELPPSDWELYGWLTVAGAALFFAAVAVGIAWLRRRKPQEITPPEILARRALEALRGRTEDAALAVEVSRVLRRYVLLAFGLAPDELTTAEIRQTLQLSAPVDPGLATAITDFLRECDERKFAPAPSPPQAGVVDRALALLEKVDASRRQPLQSAPPVTGSGPVTSAAT